MTRSSARRLRKRAAARSAPSTAKPHRKEQTLGKQLRAPFTWVGIAISTPLYVTGMLQSWQGAADGIPWFVAAFLMGAFAWLPVEWLLLTKLVRKWQKKRLAPETLGLFGAIAFTLVTGAVVVAIRAAASAS